MYQCTAGSQIKNNILCSKKYQIRFHQYTALKRRGLMGLPHAVKQLVSHCISIRHDKLIFFVQTECKKEHFHSRKNAQNNQYIPNFRTCQINLCFCLFHYEPHLLHPQYMADVFWLHLMFSRCILQAHQASA